MRAVWNPHMDNYVVRDNTEALRTAEKQAAAFTEDHRRLLRIKAKTDLFFLATGVLGYDKLSKNLHGHLCTWLRETSLQAQFRLVLLPRSHYKSTIVTITDSIQIALPDDTGNQPYPRNLGPDVRILVAHEGDIHAARFLVSITDHFRLNPSMLMLFPECVPGKAQRMNQKELELPRNKIWSEPTFDVMGVGTKSQGRHYNQLKLDDIFGEEARDSESVRKKTIMWFDNIQAFFVTPKTDKLDISGTRWRFDDVYGHAMDAYGKSLYRYIRGAEENGKPIFPEEHTSDSFRILKKNPLVWYPQFMNNPAAGQAEIPEEYIRYYQPVPSKPTKLFAQSPTGDVVSDIWEMDRLIFIDPATKGDSGIVVTGTTSARKHQIFVLEAIQDSFSPERLVEKIFYLVNRWNPRLVVIEEVLFSIVYQPWLIREQTIRGRRFRIEGARTLQKSKEDRVRGLVNYFANGQIFLDKSQAELVRQIREFGLTADYHMLDAMAYGPRYWRTATDPRESEKRKEAVELLHQQRDPITGYSRIG